MATTHSLIAIYDLRVAPETFDIVDFVSMANAAARDQACQRIVFVVYIPDELEDRLYAKNLSTGDSNLRVRNVLCQCLATFRSKRESDVEIVYGIDALRTLLERRSGEPVYPSRYDLKRPAEGHSVNHFVRTKGVLPELAPHPENLTAARQWLEEKAIDPKRAITITLRESEAFPERNVTLSDWIQIADWLAHEGWTPVIVRDTAKCLQADHRISHIASCPRASLNIPFRAALYQLCALNLHLTGGPSTLCIANPAAAFVYFFKIVAGCGAVSIDGLIDDAFLPGAQWPDASPTRRVFWECGRFESLRRAIGETLSAVSGYQPTPARALRLGIATSLAKRRTYDALDLSAIAQTIHPNDDELHRFRLKALLAAKRYEEAILTRIQHSTRGNYRSTNQALAVAWKELSDQDIATVAYALIDQPAAFFEANPAFAFLDAPDRSDAWERYLGHLLDQKRFNLACAVAEALFQQGQNPSWLFVELWSDCCRQLIDSGQPGSASLIAQQLFQAAPTAAISELVFDILGQNREIRSALEFARALQRNQPTIWRQLFRLAPTSATAVQGGTVVIYGAGAGASIAAHDCLQLGKRIIAVCETQPKPGLSCLGHPIVDLQTALGLQPEGILLASLDHGVDMLLALLNHGYDIRRIELASFPSPKSP